MDSNIIILPNLHIGSLKFCLKGQCHEIFDLWFFHQTIPPRALIHVLKPFRIWIRIRRENRLCNRQNRPDRDRGSGFSSLIETAEAFITPRKPSRNEYWLSVPLKGYYSKNKYICKHYILTAIRKRTVPVKGEL
jgi:hypothetical protein